MYWCWSYKNERNFYIFRMIIKKQTNKPKDSSFCFKLLTAEQIVMECLLKWWRYTNKWEEQSLCSHEFAVFKGVSGGSRKDRQQPSKSDNPSSEKCHKENTVEVQWHTWSRTGKPILLRTAR